MAPPRSLISVSIADFLRRLSTAAGFEASRLAAAEQYALAKAEEPAAEAQSESSRKVQTAEKCKAWL
jgi:hypothetical protein